MFAHLEFVATFHDCQLSLNSLKTISWLEMPRVTIHESVIAYEEKMKYELKIFTNSGQFSHNLIKKDPYLCLPVV